jgi:ATP-dependent DNA helicase PIF1
VKIEKDEYFQKALTFLEESNDCLFLTGRAGTGKSTLLSYFMEHTKKNVVVLAPTGVAALNVRGETIHSFFRFPPGITPERAKKEARRVKNQNLFLAIEMIIIDEISMVRADLLDCIDIFLKTLFASKKPFGNIRMVFIGDLYQLPPVVTREDQKFFQEMYESPYFFSAHVLKEEGFSFSFIELEKIYRQNDETFISLLNKIRKNTISDQELSFLNLRVKLPENDEGYLYLTSTNLMATKINEEKLSGLEEKLHQFEADLDGEFDQKSSPTDHLLKLKKGAQVIFLVNHSDNLWVNGTIGKIKEVDREQILVETEEGEEVEVKRHSWTLYKYNYDADKKKLFQEEVGSFRQYPLKLAWALTIHKSQGKSFDKVILDLERGSFAHGQTYVALSRCRTMEGLFLKKPLKKGHILMDLRVVQFLTHYQYALSEKLLPKEEKLSFLQKAIEKRELLDIVYLKSDDQKSFRTIEPLSVGEREYCGKSFLGLDAFCRERNEKRVFRLDRILEIKKHDE